MDGLESPIFTVLARALASAVPADRVEPALLRRWRRHAVEWGIPICGAPGPTCWGPFFGWWSPWPHSHSKGSYCQQVCRHHQPVFVDVRGSAFGLAARLRVLCFWRVPRVFLVGGVCSLPFGSAAAKGPCLQPLLFALGEFAPCLSALPRQRALPPTVLFVLVEFLSLPSGKGTLPPTSGCVV